MGVSNRLLGVVHTDNGRLRVDFLDIGQGDATLITFSTKEQMLIDCSVDARILEALGRHMPFYDHTIDYLVVTHPDKDHYGGCIDVLRRFTVRHILYTGLDKPTAQDWFILKDALSVEEAEVIIPPIQQTWTIGSSTLRILFPDESVDLSEGDGIVQAGDSNNTSIVLHLTHGDISLLFMADAERPLEEYLVGTYGDLLDVDILKVGHHGSLTSSDPAFLDVVTPEHAIISVGRDNPYGHPSYRILRRLEREGAAVWRTDMQSDITLQTDGIVIQMKAKNNNIVL